MESDYIKTRMRQIESSYKYLDLSKCEWLYHDDRIYFTNNQIKPMFSKETFISKLLRKLKLKKNITYGRPKDIK